LEPVQRKFLKEVAAIRECRCNAEYGGRDGNAGA
jgi:hypothetical protein